MMKKILFVTLVCIWSVVSMYAWDRNILISTKNTSLLFAAQNDGDLRFAYYGDKITPDQINQIHDIWAGLNRPAYPTFGTSGSASGWKYDSGSYRERCNDKKCRKRRTDGSDFKR